MKGKLLGPGAVFGAAFLWGCIGIFTRKLTALGLAPFEISFVRAGVAALALFVVLLCRDPALLRIRFRDLPLFLGTGIASYLFFNYCYMTSIGLNSLSVAALLMYTSPIWITLFAALFFREPLTLQKGVALVLALGGCALVSLQGEVRVTTGGLVYGLLSGFGYALYTVFGRPAVKRYPPLTVTFYTFLVAFLAGIPLLFVMPGCDLARHLSAPGAPLWALGVGVLITLCPYLLYTVGLAHMEASRAAILSILEPIVATIVGRIAFSEHVSPAALGGIVLVVAGLSLLELPLKKRREAGKTEES